MALVNVHNHSHLAKDLRTGAVINTNTAAYDAYVRARDAATKEKERIATLEAKVDRLTELLEKLVNDKSNLV